jgi:hypothetical protein
MLGPFLYHTELLFDVLIGHHRAFNYRFTERLYQYALGCYSITSASDKPFFCRVNRSKHTGRHVRLFVLPVCSNQYTSIELTHKKPCAFITTPSWVIVLSDTERHEFTGQLDPYNGGTLWVESQGLVESDRVSLDETLSWFSGCDYVTPSALAQHFPSIVDESYSPSNRILMPVAHPLKNQVITSSINIIKFLLALVPDTKDEEEPVATSLKQRLYQVQTSLRHASSMKAKAAAMSRDKSLPPPPTFQSSRPTPREPEETTDQTPALETILEEAAISSEGESESDAEFESAQTPGHQDSKPKRGVVKAKGLILAWIRAAKVLVVTGAQNFTLRNLMLLTYKFWSKSEDLPPLKTLKPSALLYALLAELNTKLKPSVEAGYALNDLVVAVLTDAALKADSSLMELLVVLTSEVIDIDRVLPTDIQPFLEADAGAALEERLKKLVVTPVKPIAKLVREMSSLTTTEDVIDELV